MQKASEEWVVEQVITMSSGLRFLGIHFLCSVCVSPSSQVECHSKNVKSLVFWDAQPRM